MNGDAKHTRCQGRGKRRFACGLGLLCLLVFCMPAIAENKADMDGFLIQKGIELTWLAQEIAASDCAQLLVPREEMTTIVREIAKYDYASPSKAVFFTVDPSFVLPLLAEEGLQEKLPEDILIYMEQRALGSIPIQLSGGHGAEYMTVASILSVGEAYLLPEGDFQQTILCLFFEDVPYVSTVVFLNAGEGIISGTAMFVYMDEEYEDLLAEDVLPFPGMNLRPYTEVTAYTQTELAQWIPDRIAK